MGMGEGTEEIIYLSLSNQSGNATMKIFNIILAILFLLFAAVQFNDSPGDILFWVLVYAGVGIISGFAAFNKYNMWAILLGLAVVVFELFRKFPTFALWVSDGMPSIVGEMKASSPYVELAREYLGLCLCLAVLIFQYVRFAKLRKQEAPFVE
jgi:Transmembrane family 220, helix